MKAFRHSCGHGLHMLSGWWYLTQVRSGQPMAFARFPRKGSLGNENMPQGRALWKGKKPKADKMRSWPCRNMAWTTTMKDFNRGRCIILLYAVFMWVTMAWHVSIGIWFEDPFVRFAGTCESKASWVNYFMPKACYQKLWDNLVGTLPYNIESQVHWKLVRSLIFSITNCPLLLSVHRFLAEYLHHMAGCLSVVHINEFRWINVLPYQYMVNIDWSASAHPLLPIYWEYSMYMRKLWAGKYE